MNFKDNKKYIIILIILFSILFCLCFVVSKENSVKADTFDSDNFDGIGFKGWDNSTIHYNCSNAVNPVTNSETLMYPLIYTSYSPADCGCTLYSTSEAETMLKHLNYQVLTGNNSYDSSKTANNANTALIKFYNFVDNQNSKNFLIGYFGSANSNRNPVTAISGGTSYRDDGSIASTRGFTMLYDIDNNIVYWLADFTNTLYNATTTDQNFMQSGLFSGFDFIGSGSYFLHDENMISDVLIYTQHIGQSNGKISGNSNDVFDFYMTSFFVYQGNRLRATNSAVLSNPIYSSRYSDNESSSANYQGRGIIYDFRDIFGFYVPDGYLAQYYNADILSSIPAFNLNTVNVWEATPTEPDDVYPNNTPNTPGYLEEHEIDNTIYDTTTQQNTLLDLLNNMDDGLVNFNDLLNENMSEYIDDLSSEVGNTIEGYVSHFNTGYFNGQSYFGDTLSLSYAVFVDECIDGIDFLNMLFNCACGICAIVIVILI